jgi:hypothetical protein
VLTGQAPLCQKHVFVGSEVGIFGMRPVYNLQASLRKGYWAEYAVLRPQAEASFLRNH